MNLAQPTTARRPVNAADLEGNCLTCGEHATVKEGCCGSIWCEGSTYDPSEWCETCGFSLADEECTCPKPDVTHEEVMARFDASIAAMHALTAKVKEEHQRVLAERQSRSLGAAMRDGDAFCSMCGRYVADHGPGCEACANNHHNDQQEG